MQGKGLIIIVAIVLGLISLNELLPTFYSSRIESQAAAVAGGDQAKYQKEIARLSKDTLNLGFTKLHYADAKQREMKLGLDLKGGINVLLEINQRDLVNDLTNYSSNLRETSVLGSAADQRSASLLRPAIQNHSRQSGFYWCKQKCAFHQPSST